MATMSGDPPKSDPARRAIAQQHLKQLDALALDDLKSPSGKPEDDATPILDQLKQWTQAQQPAIKVARAKNVYGGPAGSPINWNIVFLPFMESCATYLRDDALILKAVAAFRNGDEEKALDFYFDSTSEIRELAALWGMDFVMLCDLVDKHPPGHDLWDGPYCGAFYSKTDSYPCLGIAFKGTGFHLREWDDDWNFQPIKGTIYLPGIDVSEGVYTGLFEDPSTGNAFDTIRAGVNALRIPNCTGFPVHVHIAGHSLGASYATLCFLGLFQQPLDQQKYALGDIYTFGSPRLGLHSLVEAYIKLLDKPGSPYQSWRIVNADDVVPQIPPIKFVPPYDVVFQHIDQGMQMFLSSTPVTMPSERDADPSSWWAMPWTAYREVKAHHVASYYESLSYVLSNFSTVTDKDGDEMKV